jgi:hypothetical protein
MTFVPTVTVIVLFVNFELLLENQERASVPVSLYGIYDPSDDGGGDLPVERSTVERFLRNTIPALTSSFPTASINFLWNSPPRHSTCTPIIQPLPNRQSAFACGCLDEASMNALNL